MDQEKKSNIQYVPKKQSPTAPADYRPLSMLEMLYKIPSRILAKRQTMVLPRDHMHGFMAGKGLQEPFLLPTHLTQYAQQCKQPFQLVSLDIKKAFVCIGHELFVQALRAFVVLEILIQALRHYTLVGYEKVEVNRHRGILITIKTGSGLGTHSLASSS